MQVKVRPLTVMVTFGMFGGWLLHRRCENPYDTPLYLLAGVALAILTSVSMTRDVNHLD